MRPDLSSFVSGECHLVVRQIEAFVDGELSGADRLFVAQHLELCRSCASSAQALTGLGDVLRGAVAEDLPTPEMAGLASGVFSRIGAESAQSWRGLAARAADGWHWAIVGGGSVAATFVTTAFVAFILAFGPKPEREDSLAALISNLGRPPGMLFLYATPGGDGGDSVLMQVDNGEPAASILTAALATPIGFRPQTEAELVGALANALTRKGRVVNLYLMTPEDRRYTESLLDEINRLRFTEPLTVGAAVAVHQVRLVTSTGVTAKGL